MLFMSSVFGVADSRAASHTPRNKKTVPRKDGYSLHLFYKNLGRETIILVEDILHFGESNKALATDARLVVGIVTNNGRDRSWAGGAMNAQA